MLKYFGLLLNLLGVLFLNFFSIGDASLTMSVPREVTAGMEFDVSVTLKKGQAESFARFQQELPRGLTELRLPLTPMLPLRLKTKRLSLFG